MCQGRALKARSRVSSGFKKKQKNTKETQQPWLASSVNFSGFGHSLMRAIKSHYAENRKVNTDPYANWQILLRVRAGCLLPLLSPAPSPAQCLSSPPAKLLHHALVLLCSLLVLLLPGRLLLCWLIPTSLKVNTRMPRPPLPTPTPLASVSPAGPVALNTAQVLVTLTFPSPAWAHMVGSGEPSARFPGSSQLQSCWWLEVGV